MALKPLRVVPSHGSIGDATLIAEIAPSYPAWGNPQGAAAAARAAYAEVR